MGNSSSMSLESSLTVQTAILDGEEDYDCAICQDIFRMPVRTKACQHVFCKICLETALQCQGPHCPFCRTLLTKKAPIANDVLKRMRQKLGRCRACGKETFLSKMRLHYKSCRKYKEEYGLMTDAPPMAPVQTPVQTYNTVTALTSTTSPPLLMPHTTQHGQSAVRLYSCPYCPLEGLMDMNLVQHCLLHHAGEIRPAVCPICARMTFGNPNYHSRNLILHMQLRHCYSYAEYMNEEADEDVQLCHALQMSVQEI